MSMTFYAATIVDRYCKPVNGDDCNMSERNARLVLQATGVEDCGTCPIDPFIALCTAYLRRGIGKLSAELPTQRHGIMIDCGLPEGYINQRVMQLSRMAQTGKDAGATHFTWG